MSRIRVCIHKDIASENEMGWEERSIYCTISLVNHDPRSHVLQVIEIFLHHCI